jgi:hypothetical protein
MTSWLITALLAVIIAWIIYTEVRCGRRSKAFLAKANEEINALGRSATIAYRAKYGRDPTAPFIRIDDSDKVSSKGS